MADSAVIFQSVAAAVEAVGYAVAAFVVSRRAVQPHLAPIHRRFRWWWALGAVGVAMTPLQGVLFSTGYLTPTAWRATAAIGIGSAVLGAAMLVEFLFFVVRGKRVPAAAVHVPFGLVLVASVWIIATADITAVVTRGGLAGADYASAPSGIVVALQALVVLVPLALAVVLIVAARRSEGMARTRSRLVGAAIVVWYVAKFLQTSALVTGTGVAFVPGYRVAGLAAAGLGILAYTRFGGPPARGVQAAHQRDRAPVTSR